VSEDTASAPANVSPGDQIAGYRLEEQIGQGGMAVVYRAHDERLDRSVALKLLAPGLASDTAFRTRFIRESRAAAAVDHPNIIPVYDAGDAGGFLFISMRYVQGGDVRSLIADGKPLPPARAWHIISQVAAALDAAHAQGLVHRDVKPANMLLDASGKTGSAKRSAADEGMHDHVYLSDFGISKRTVASNLTSTGQFVGTLDYIAPEQVEGQAIDGRTDEYSLACAAFELLSGGPPYRRSLGLALINAHLSEAPPSLVARRAELPPAVDLVFAKAMAKTPAQRYATCEQFANDLGRALGLAPGPLEAGAAATAAPGAEPAPGNPWPATELAGPAALAAAGAATPLAPTVNQPTPAGPGPATPPPGTGQEQAGQPGQPGQPAAAPWPAGAAAGLDALTQNAPPGQTPPPQQQPMPGGWQAGGPSNPQGGYPSNPQGGYQSNPQGAYQAYQQPQPYQTGPVGPYQTGPVGPAMQPGWQPPYQGGPTGPNWQPPPKRSRAILIGSVIAAVAIAAAAVAIVYFVVLKKNTGTGSNANGQNSSSSAPVSNSSAPSTPPTSSAPPPAQTAQSEATSINNLLVSSAQSRSQWDSTVLVADTGQCINISSDVTQIGDIANERMTELGQARALQVGAIPNGAALKHELIVALRISYTIDNDYLLWAQQQQSTGCGVGYNSSYYSDASNRDSQATYDKQIFLDSWNPIASQYGLQQFNSGQI